MNSATSQDDRLYILAAFSVFLSLIEYMVPKPFPFMRLGLANLPILIALEIFPARRVLLLTLYKVIAQGLVQGTLFSYVFLFSFAGSFAAGLAMIGVHRLLGQRISLIGVSVLGAFAGNMVRLFLARYILFGDQVWIIAPPFLIMGLISSILIGVFSAAFAARSHWLNRVAEPGT